MTLRDCMSINGQNNAIAVEGNANHGTYTLSDIVVHGTAQGCAHNGTGSKTTNWTRVTKIGGAYGFAIWNGSGSLNVAGGIIADCTDPNGSGASLAATCRGYNNGAADGLTELNPYTNGLTYLMRVEAASTLAGIPCGTDVRYKHGTDGTLHGETGWDTVTADALWPWPYQDRIKTEMAAVSTRGFCAVGGETLTDYIAELLGGVSPY